MEDFDDGTDGPRGSGSSIAAPLVRALLAAAIGFAVYWLVFAPGDPADDVAVLPEPTTTDVATEITPTPAFTTPPPLVDATVAPTEGVPAQIGVGLSAQLLNGTDDPALFASALELLSSYGYDVIQSGRAANDYSQTTIFATAGQEASADALLTADPRFTVIGDNPGLDTSIDVHVVVGEDWVVDPVATSTPTDGATAQATATEG